MNQVGLARFRSLFSPRGEPIVKAKATQERRMVKERQVRRRQFPQGGIRVNLIVSPETYAALDRRARKNGNSLSKEARNAIQNHLTR